MTKFLAKGSKLIIIYILTVIVSGSILTYLSINNISNFEELTEKRITEEEKTIIENYRLQFQSTLVNLAGFLTKEIQTDSVPSAKKNPIVDNGLVNDYLIMNKNGVLIRPHFVQNTFSSNKNEITFSLIRRYKQAEQSEFVQKDYNTAEKQYINLLKFAKTKSDSAKIYNAVARLNIKTGNQKRAFEIYYQIIKNFNFTLNDFGFPYAYFSMDQLLKLTDDSLKIDVEDLLVTFLRGLVNNQIPYNNSSSDLILGIQNKIDQIENKETRQSVKTLCQDITKKITSIIDYDKSMQAVVKGEELEPPLRLMNFFVIANANNNEIMLLHQSDENSVGFTVALKNLNSLVLENLNPTLSNFEYDLQLIDAGLNDSFFEKELIVQNNFSPFFNNKLIQVKLKNPNIVKDYVFKRKLTTGIGLFLLLGAMTLGLFILIRDVNRKNHMASLRADFVSNVTHELKTPLTSINMFAESIFLGRVKSDSDLKKYANTIVKESERLKRMINNILDFSRKENEKLSYHLKECDLLDIVNSTMKEMNYWLEINEFNVTLDLQQNIKAIVDPEGIKQVLSNLISNAIKYSDIKKKMIVRLYKKEKKAFIEIEDFGIGIPQDKLKSIFEKFYRVNSKKNENISGTGLGLTVSKDIIEAQNGKLFVNSILNKGSKFTIVLNI